MMERRLRIRFPLALDIHYRIMGKRGVKGRGKSINISSSGALVALDHTISSGTGIQMNIAWPTSHDGVPLELVVQGLVLREEQERLAVQFVFKNLVVVLEWPRGEGFCEQNAGLTGTGSGAV